MSGVLAADPPTRPCLSPSQVCTGIPNTQWWVGGGIHTPPPPPGGRGKNNFPVSLAAPAFRSKFAVSAFGAEIFFLLCGAIDPPPHQTFSHSLRPSSLACVMRPLWGGGQVRQWLRHVGQRACRWLRLGVWATAPLAIDCGSVVGRQKRGSQGIPGSHHCNLHLEQCLASHCHPCCKTVPPPRHRMTRLPRWSRGCGSPASTSRGSASRPGGASCGAPPPTWTRRPSGVVGPTARRKCTEVWGGLLCFRHLLEELQHTAASPTSGNEIVSGPPYWMMLGDAGILLQSFRMFQDSYGRSFSTNLQC